MYYCAQGQSRRWHIGDWFLAYRVLRGFSRGSHVGYPIPPPSPPPPPPIKIRSVINGMSRDIFRPSFMYEAPITIGRRIIETSASIDRQPRYRQLLSALRGVTNARVCACARKNAPPPLLISPKFRPDFPHGKSFYSFFCAYPRDMIFPFFLFSMSTLNSIPPSIEILRVIFYISREREYIYFFFEYFVTSGKEK